MINSLSDIINSGIQYSVVGRYVGENNIAIAYRIEGTDNSIIKVNINQLIELIKANCVINCRLQIYRGTYIIIGNGINLNELPIINRANSSITKNMTPKNIEVTKNDILTFVHTYSFYLKEDSCLSVKNLQDGTARLYIQTIKNNIYSIEDYKTTVIKFGINNGVAIRLVNRITKETFDIKERTFSIDRLNNEKLLIAIICTGILKIKNIASFGVIALQSINNMQEQKIYEIDRKQI